MLQYGPAKNTVKSKTLIPFNNPSDILITFSFSSIIYHDNNYIRQCICNPYANYD